ncbi:MAG TPA: hypothetical protein VGP62_02620 [Bryobacteraceae bacterium]|nr:hypothetical protein [Bryobacteraceae bacterium]
MTTHGTLIHAGLAALFLSVLALDAQVNVLTYHNDLSRTGQNLNETILTPSSLAEEEFGQLFTLPVDGQVYAQPLYMSGLNIPGKGIHNVVFIATEHDSVYAFDADSNAAPNTAPLWQASFINPAAGVTPVPAGNLGCIAIAPELGITSTPVIDSNTGALYVVSMTLEDFGRTYVHRLHALDVATGAERLGSPVEIAASAPGTGDGNTLVTFQHCSYKERAGLLLLNGVVYTTWGSNCDSGGYHGWVIGYDAKTLARAAVYLTTPNWEAGAIWQSGAAPAADASGNIYIVTGNGTFDAERSGPDLGDSVIKLSTANGLSVTDYFTPFNTDLLAVNDIDLGSSGALLLPDSAGTPQHPHLLVTGGKEGRVYLLDRDRMGHSSSQDDSQIVQSLPAAVGPLYGVPVYFNNTIFFSAQGDRIKAFPLSNGLLSENPSSATTASIPGLGSVPSISANGSKDGIVWTIQPDAVHAYAASNLASELYTASFGSYIKFSTPTIANGKVYVGTANSVVVFGLLNSPHIGVILNSAGNQAGAVAPGSIVSVYGVNLSAGTLTASQNPLPKVLLGSRVLINGLLAPLLSVSPSQIDAQVPYEVLAGVARVVAVQGNSASVPAGLEVQQTAPGIFAVMLNQDGTVNGPNHSAAPGSNLRVFATGLGPTEPSLRTGVAAPQGPPASAVAPLSAAMGGQNTAVLSAGLAPGLVGVFEVILTVPVEPAGIYPLVIQAGGVSSNSIMVNIAP